MLYFDEIPLDWQLSMLNNNSQDGENNVDLSLLNQISNEQQVSKEILDLKLTDNQLEHFLSTMDQPLVNPYHQKHINTTQNLSSLPTTSTIVPSQFLDTTTTIPQTDNIMTGLASLHDLNNINNTGVSLASVKSETEIPVNYTNEQQQQQQLLQELLHSKLNSMPTAGTTDINYSSLLYNNNLINENGQAYGMGSESSIGTKRKEAIPDLSSIHPNANKKIKKISDSMAYALPTTGITPSTVASASSNLHPNPNAVMDLPVHNYSNNLQQTSPSTLNQDQILLHYINTMKNKEVTAASNASPTTASAVDMNNILSTLIANSHQNMNSVIASQDTLNANTIAATTAAVATGDINPGLIPTINTAIKPEIDYLHLLQAAQQQNAKGKKEEPDSNSGSAANFISPNIIHMTSHISPQVPPPATQEPSQQTTPQPIHSIATTIPSPVDVMPVTSPASTVKSPTDNDGIRSGKESINTSATILKKVKIEEPVTKGDHSVSGPATLDSSGKINSTSSSTSVSTSVTNPPKYLLNASGSSTTPPTTSASNAKLNNVSWVKTQEKGEMKMAISRLKANEPAVPVIPLQVIKHQKKVAHNAIERKYRNNINDRIKQLQDVIPALQYTKNIKEREKNQKEKGGGNEDDVVKIDESLIIDGIPAARKLNKATVLKSATDYIVHLKKTSTNLKEENKRLLDFIKKMGGDEMVNQFTIENSDLYEDKTAQETPSASTTTTTTTKGKEKGKKKEKGKQGKQAKPVQEASPPHIYSSDSPSPTHMNSPPSMSSNEEDTTMLEVLSGERENQQHNINFNSNSTFTTMMVSLLLFSVGLFEYGSYLNNNSDTINQYENYVVGSQGKILLARSEEPLVKPVTHPSFYQYLKSKLARMDEIIVELVVYAISKINYSLFEALFRVNNYSYTKLILSHCRMIERDILITKTQNKQCLFAVFNTTFQIINNLNFVTSEISNSTSAYILYTTAIQFYMNFRDKPFGKAVALRIWRKGNEFVFKTNEDKEDYEKTLRQSKKFDDYKKKRKINIANEAIDFILNYINENTKRSEEFFSRGHWMNFLDRSMMERSSTPYDLSNQKCLLITFATAYKYDVLLNTFKEHGLKYIYMAPSHHVKSGESTEVETDSDTESISGSNPELDKKQIKEDIKNDYLSLSNYYLSLTNYYLPSSNIISSLEAPLNKIMAKLMTDKKSKKKEKEQSSMMMIDKILNTIIKVANSSLIINDINLYWYTQILWIMVSWKKEYFKPIVSENNMNKINIQLFYADQFRKLIISSVSSYYQDVVEEDHTSEIPFPKTTYSDDLYSYTSSEEEDEDEEDEDGDDDRDKDLQGKGGESESEYVSEFKTETIPETTISETSVTSISSEFGQAYQGLARRYSGLPNYSTVHFISDYTRQFITLSLFTWLMVEKKKYNIAKRSIDKAHQILEKITTFSIRKEDLSYNNLFEEENDYYPDIKLKFERVVVILAGTWLVESEKMVLNHEKEQQEEVLMMTSMEGSSMTTTTSAPSPSSVPSEMVLVSSVSGKKDDVNMVDEVITLPKLPDESQSTSTIHNNTVTTKSSVVPKLSEYIEGFIKLIHYYQEMLPYIGSDNIAMECFKTIQHYQNEYKKLCLECY
ncbi:hypothetical protein PIROE2DRAFT_13355 [Piromyces sp. E2]|nr:hypothetical protein PIROE2DRAFT_13355 [Piromyces sp. E2]|eukprot:OUM60800.1 hypothetical protein PIROE2DRAFT_13355 [Piromyces sp. E2]